MSNPTTTGEGVPGGHGKPWPMPTTGEWTEQFILDEFPSVAPSDAKELAEEINAALAAEREQRKSAETEWWATLQRQRQQLRAAHASEQDLKLRIMVEALRAVVDTWERSFKGQETGYEGTELEDNYKKAKAALGGLK